MTKKLTQERRNEIAQKLLVDGKVSASQLAAEYDVSAETIRKDMIYLEENGIAKKGYGGAVVMSELVEPSFLEKSVENQEKKTLIAAQAAKLVQDGSTILLDGGSTVLALAKQLVLKKDITVFTNSIQAAQILLDSGAKVYMLGGELRNTSNAAVGSWALRALAEIKADIAFLGTSGFAGRQGPCIENFYEGDIKQAMIRSANRTVVIADSSKAGKDSMVQFARWEEIDLLITDQGLKDIEELEQKTQIKFAQEKKV